MTERLNRTELMSQMGFPASLVVKNLLANASDTDLISASERSTEEGNGDPLQYSCLGKSHGQRNLVGVLESEKQIKGHSSEYYL